MIQSLSLLGFGLLLITLIDVLGSISSRRMNYNYAYLSPLSFLAYGFIGYQGYHITTLAWTLVITFLTGIYDGTIGWKLAILLNANLGDRPEQTKNLSISSRILVMIVISGFFGVTGFLIAGFMATNL